MITAARVGHAFGMDPCDVLAETTVVRQVVRVAALLVVVEDEKAKWGG